MWNESLNVFTQLLSRWNEPVDVWNETLDKLNETRLTSSRQRRILQYISTEDALLQQKLSTYGV